MNQNSAFSQAVTRTVEPGDEDRRLDNYLLSFLKGVPRSRVYRMIRGGEVRVNGRRARPDYRLSSGDRVRVPPVRRDPRTGAKAARGVDWIEPRVLLEEKTFLVLDKPAGLAVHGGSGISAGAIELLRGTRGPRQFLELVHRLDRDTSGCLLIAKRKSTLRRLHEAFREGQVAKRYTALLGGRMAKGIREISAPLLTTQRRGGERHVRVDEAGKPALTRFHPLRWFDAATLVDVELETGRTHQIRVHATAAGHPVVGDTRYGPLEDSVAGSCGLQRLFLHARLLAFDAPGNGHRIEVEAPLDPPLEDALRRLADKKPD